MQFNPALFASRLNTACTALSISVQQLSERTGIPPEILRQYSSQAATPSGDHILILSDVLKCEISYLIDERSPDPFSTTSILFRAHEREISAADREIIQETLLRSRYEELLLRVLAIRITPFHFEPRGKFFKRHGTDAAEKLRNQLQYSSKELRRDVFSEFRRLGLCIFRRRLNGKGISGLFIRQSDATQCIIVNYEEDFFRQRFTVAHECGHAILDAGESFNVSLRSEGSDLREIRANAFASAFLLPREIATHLPDPNNWDADDIVKWSTELMLSPAALAIGLRQHRRLERAQFDRIRDCRVPRESKHDPELPPDLSPKGRAAKIAALERGLSSHFVNLCIEGFQRGFLSRGKMRELLSCSEGDLPEFAALFGRSLSNEH